MLTRLPIRSRFLAVATLVGLLVAFGVSSAQDQDPTIVFTTVPLLRTTPIRLFLPESNEGAIVTILGAQWPTEGAVRLWERVNATTGALEILSDEVLFLNVGPNATIDVRDREGGTPMDGPLGFIFPFREERGGNVSVMVSCRVPILAGSERTTIAVRFASNTESDGITPGVSDRLMVAISPVDVLEPTCPFVSP
jgi:hypothetical protein